MNKFFFKPMAEDNKRHIIDDLLFVIFGEYKSITYDIEKHKWYILDIYGHPIYFNGSLDEIAENLYTTIISPKSIEKIKLNFNI